MSELMTSDRIILSLNSRLIKIESIDVLILGWFNRLFTVLSETVGISYHEGLFVKSSLDNSKVLTEKLVSINEVFPILDLLMALIAKRNQFEFMSGYVPPDASNNGKGKINPLPASLPQTVNTPTPQIVPNPAVASVVPSSSNIPSTPISDPVSVAHVPLTEEKNVAVEALIARAMSACNGDKALENSLREAIANGDTASVYSILIGLKLVENNSQ